MKGSRVRGITVRGMGLGKLVRGKSQKGRLLGKGKG
jgi:hypothetical protein